jgi:hypothetical protein
MPQPFDKNDIKGSPANPAAAAEDWQQIVSALVKSLKFGTVQIVIQDGKVVQIDSTEKIRLDQPQPKSTFGKKWTPPSAK